MGPVLARTGDTVIFVVSFVFFFISIDSLQGVGNYGDIDITLVREDVLASYTLRTFSLKVVSSPTNKKKKVCRFSCVSISTNTLYIQGEKVSRTVYQYHYTAWPDHGVPLHALPLITFVRYLHHQP